MNTAEKAADYQAMAERIANFILNEKSLTRPIEAARRVFGADFMSQQDHAELLSLYQLFKNGDLTAPEIILKAYRIGWEGAQLSHAGRTQ